MTISIKHSLLLCISIATLHADEFQQFSGIMGYSGYAQTPVGPKTKIRVYPQITVLPEYPAIVKNNGSINVPCFIRTKTPPDGLRSAVLKRVLNLSGSYPGYGIDVMLLSDAALSLIVDNKIVGSDKLTDALTPSSTGYIPGSIHYDGEDLDVIKSILTGDYIISMKYTFPLSSFSGLYVKINQNGLTNVKTSAFKKFATSIKKEAGGILFWKYSSEVASTSASERFSSDQNTSLDTTTNIVMVDPDPELQAELEKVLGFSQTTQAALVAKHTAAANQTSSDDLADLHSKYASAVAAKDIDAQIDVLKAVALLSAGDIMGFLANGLAFNKSSTSSNFNYYSSSNVTVDTAYEQNFNKTLIKNSRIVGELRNGPFTQEAKAQNDAYIARLGMGLQYAADPALAHSLYFFKAIETNKLDLFWRLIISDESVINYQAPNVYNKMMTPHAYAGFKNRDKMVAILEHLGADE